MTRSTFIFAATLLALDATTITDTAPPGAIVGAQPQLATDGAIVGLTYGLGNAVSFSRSRDQGRTWSPAVTVPTSGVLSLGKRRGPRIAMTAEAIVIAAVTGAKGGGADGDLTAWRSTDDGHTWGEAARLNDVEGSAREGLHGLAANASGVVAAAWLDLRAQKTRIYATVSRDHGLTWSPNVEAYASPDGAVCECCHPSVAVGANGTITIMFRNHLAGARDMYVTQSSDGKTFTAATKLGRGTWPLDACPMDGGSLGSGEGDRLATAWRREKTIFLARPGEPERTVGEGVDPVLVARGQALTVAWTTPDGISVWHSETGRPTTMGPGRFASLIAQPDGSMILAREVDREIVVDAVSATAP